MTEHDYLDEWLQVQCDNVPQRRVNDEQRCVVLDELFDVDDCRNEKGEKCRYY